MHVGFTARTIKFRSEFISLCGWRKHLLLQQSLLFSQNFRRLLVCIVPRTIKVYHNENISSRWYHFSCQCNLCFRCWEFARHIGQNSAYLWPPCIYACELCVGLLSWWDTQPHLSYFFLDTAIVMSTEKTKTAFPISSSSAMNGIQM